MEICVNGTLIGDEAFVRATLRADVEKTGATIYKINSLLCDLSGQLNQAFNMYLCQTLLQHHAQTSTPPYVDPLRRRSPQASWTTT